MNTKKLPSKSEWELEREALKNRKIVLALDTSVTGCSICIGDGKSFWQERLETERGQAELLVPMINDVVRKSSYAYNDIDRFIVTTGPGSFTGVRIGLATAKGMALALNKPLFGFSTLSVIARGLNLDKNTLILIDTKRGDYYGQVFANEGEAIDQPKIWTAEMISVSGIPFIETVIPNIEVLAGMGLKVESDELAYRADFAPLPLYLRGAEVSQSKRIAPKIVSNTAG